MVLTGLRNTNLQGYLAALGVVKLIPQARLGWDKLTGCAVLEGVENPVMELEKLLKVQDPYARLMWLSAKSDEAKQLKHLTGKKKGLDKAEQKAINAQIKTINDHHSVEKFRDQQAANAPADWGTPDDVFWLQGLWSPEGESNQLNLMGKGNSPKGFFGALAKSRECIINKGRAKDKLNEALFGPWRHEDPVGAMKWEMESIGYGPRHRGDKKPSDTPQRSVAAAQWLAGEGLPVVGCVTDTEIDLPLWFRPEAYSVIVERLKHHVGEAYMRAVRDELPLTNPLFYWEARTLSEGKKPGGSRKESSRVYNDLYNGSELWMV